jgi:AraC-like DNA-binding protein
MTIKISSYYYKHLLNRIAVDNKKQVKAPKIASFIGLSIKLNEFIQLAESCALVEKDPLFPIRTAAKSLPPGHGILGLLVQSCNTLGEACAYGYKFQHLTRSGLHSQLSYEKGTVTSYIDIGSHDPESISALIEYCQGSLFAIANYLVDWSQPIKIKEIHFMHSSRAPISEYKKILETDNILFSQAENKIVFSREIMDYPIERSDPGAKQALLQEAKSQLHSLKGAESVEDRLRGLLLEQNMFNNKSQLECAQLLKMSESTLKRRLQEEGTSYKSILDEVREYFAKRFLANAALSIQSISEMLEFSNRSAFARSFRNWTGLSPLQYRQSISEDD